MTSSPTKGSAVSRPTHRTPSSAMRREERIRGFLQPMFDFPVPRAHAGRRSVRKAARPWELTSTGDGNQPEMNRATRRAYGIR